MLPQKIENNVIDPIRSKMELAGNLFLHTKNTLHVRLVKIFGKYVER